MSNRFIYSYLIALFISSGYFYLGIEPNFLNTELERALAIFLFQSDYFFLFFYCLVKASQSFIYPRLHICLIYLALISIGLMSVLIIDEQKYDNVYAIVQVIIRGFMLLLFWRTKSKLPISKFQIVMAVLILLFGILHFYLINLYPRDSVLVFDFNSVLSTLIFACIFLISLPVTIPRWIFYFGIIAIGISDYYFILPKQLRVYELTFFILRIINSLGEIAVCYVLLEHFKLKSGPNYVSWLQRNNVN